MEAFMFPMRLWITCTELLEQFTVYSIKLLLLKFQRRFLNYLCNELYIMNYDIEVHEHKILSEIILSSKIQQISDWINQISKGVTHTYQPTDRHVISSAQGPGQWRRSDGAGTAGKNNNKSKSHFTSNAPKLPAGISKASPGTSTQRQRLLMVLTLTR